MPCGPKKRRSAKKKMLVSPDNATDPHFEANVVIYPTSVEVEDRLAVKPLASAAVELIDPGGTVSSKEAVLVDNMSSEGVVELVNNQNDGKDVLKNVRDPTLREVEGNELAEEGLDSGPTENGGKPVVEDSLTDQLELVTGAKIEGKELAAGIVSDEDDSVFFEEAIENCFSDDMSVKMYEPVNGKKLLMKAIDEVEGLRKSMEAQIHVAETLMGHLRQLLAKWDLIQTTPTTST